jgi:quercetin dioxygenase-like cupin family protein
VERFAVGPDVAFTPGEELLEGVTVAPLSRSIYDGAPFQAALFRVAPGGRIARHPANCPQILAVLEGSGEVSGASGVAEPIGPGEAVFWSEGEEHETTSAAGLTALIVEGDGLAPFRRPA